MKKAQKNEAFNPERTRSGSYGLRLLSVLLPLCLLCAALAGCAPGTPAGPANAETSQNAQETEPSLESAGEETVTAIEGNTSAGEAGSQSDGGGVFRRTRSRKLVTAFIRPLDAAEEDDMTGKEIYEALNDYLKAQPMPAWAEKELAEAAELGLTDGKDPMALIPRYQAAIMAKRAAEKKYAAAPGAKAPGAA